MLQDVKKYSTVKVWYKAAGPNLIRKCWLWHYIKMTTREDYENERISNSKSQNSVWFFFSLSFLSKPFQSYGDVTIAGEGLQILTYARNSWPLISKGSLTCHTYCDTDQPFIMVISEDPWHSHLLPSVWKWSCHYLV